MWGTFLAAAVGPLAKKILIALGIGTITYTGIEAALSAVTAQIVANYGAMSAGTVAMVDLAGGGQAIGILLGAFTARVSMIAVSKFAKIL